MIAYEGPVIDGNGYFTDLVSAMPTVELLMELAERKYTRRGWEFKWTADGVLAAHMPGMPFIKERMRIREVELNEIASEVCLSSAELLKRGVFTMNTDQNTGDSK